MPAQAQIATYARSQRASAWALSPRGRRDIIRPRPLAGSIFFFFFPGLAAAAGSLSGVRKPDQGEERRKSTHQPCRVSMTGSGAKKKPGQSGDG